MRKKRTSSSMRITVFVPDMTIICIIWFLHRPYLFLIFFLFSLANYITFCSYIIPFHFSVPFLSSCICEPITRFVILSNSVYLCKPISSIPPKHLDISYIVSSWQFVSVRIDRNTSTVWKLIYDRNRWT